MSPQNKPGNRGTSPVKTDKRRRVQPLIRRLNEYYPVFKPKKRRDPLDELIITVLSQATNDRNSFEAFKRLKSRFKTWEEILDADIDEVEEAITIGGLAPTKSKRIRNLIRTIADRNRASMRLKKGSPYHLDFLAGMELDEARKWLTSLDGVGEKTAACVLLFSLQMPAFPIDTHVHRILIRQGIIPQNMTAEKAHGEMYKIVPPDDRYRFHVNLIQYGREICHARNPECGICVIRKTCLFKSAT